MKLTFHQKLMSLLAVHLLILLYAVANDFNWWYLLSAWLVAKLFNAIGNEIGLHRLWCHKSFNTQRWKEYILHIFALPLLYGSGVTYTGIHRQHHAYSDTEKDPHITRPWWKAFFYIRNANYSIEHRFISDVIKDPLHRWVHKNYFRLNLALLFLSMIVLGPILTGWYLCFISVYNFIAAGLVNVFGHRPEYGTRRYATKDNSSNNFWLQILTWNEGLHHNHHAQPNSPTFQTRPGDIDVPGWMINKFFLLRSNEL